MPLSAKAAIEVAWQIEELAPSAVKLEVNGINWQTAAVIAHQISNGPDLGALRDCGIDQEEAVAICTKIAARHARRDAAVLAVAAPKPAPVVAPKPTPSAPVPAAPKAVPAPIADAMDGMSALSMLHTLCEQAVSGRRACLTTLMNDGWSESFSRELVKVVNASLTVQRKVTR